MTATVVVASAMTFDWASLDWHLLTSAGAALFHRGGLRVYATRGGLQTGPLSLPMFAVLGWLGSVGLVVAHLAMLGIGAAVIVGTGRAAARRTPSSDPPTVRRPFWLVGTLAAVPALTWHLPPPNPGMLAVWAAVGLALTAFTALPRLTSSAPRGPIAMPRWVWMGLLSLGSWAVLAGGSAHVEDALAIGGLTWAVLSPADHRVRRAALVGLSVAMKPWAVVGIGVLVDRTSLRRTARDVAIAGAVAAVCFAPFFLAAGSSLHTAATQRFPVSAAATVTLLGLHAGASAPAWLRTVQLGAATAAAVVASRRGSADAVAAGMVVRLLLDPATVGYYSATAILALAVADLLGSRFEWRTIAGVIGLQLLPCVVVVLPLLAASRTLILLALLGSLTLRRPLTVRSPSRHKLGEPIVTSG